MTVITTKRNTELSNEFKTELDKREKQLLSGEVEGISWKEIKSEFLK